jgi:hypothetical protein
MIPDRRLFQLEILEKKKWRQNTWKLGVCVCMSREREYRMASGLERHLLAPEIF